MKDPKILDDHLSHNHSSKREDVILKEFEPDLYAHIMSVYSWEKAEYYLKEFEKKGIDILLEERSTPNFTRIDLKIPPEQRDFALQKLDDLKARSPRFEFPVGQFETMIFIAIVFMVFVFVMICLVFSV